MFKKVWLTAMVVAVVSLLGAASVFADGDDSQGCMFYNEDEDVWVAGFCDGRLNAFDIAQPVAIYYSYDAVLATDEDGNPYWTDVVDAIEVWAIDSEGVGQLALRVPVSQIAPALSATSDVQIAAVNGITLNYSPSANAFWVTAPGYSFTWEAW
ncbi:MAG: hypothetical protein Kow00106_10340 [Anaerolineae bacterium]